MPNNFEPQSKLLRELVLSVNKQSAWGAPAVLADGALTRKQRFGGDAVIDFAPTRRSDAEMSGKGSYFATNGQITSLDVKISGVKAELSDWLAGWLFSFCMGKDVAVGSSAPYTHTHTFDQSTRQGVPTTAYLSDTDGLQYKIPDLCVASFTLTVPPTGAISAEFDLQGTGVILPGAMATGTAGDPLIGAPTETYLLGSDANFLFGNVGAPVSILGRHMTSTIKIERETTVQRSTGGGLYGQFIRRDRPKFSVQSTIAATSVDDVYTRMINNTATAIGLAINSGTAAQLNLSIPSANLKTTKMGFDGDMTVFNVEVDETTCYQAGNVQPIIATVINSVPAYLAAYVAGP